MSHHAVDDMGLSAADLQDILDSFTWMMDVAYDTILERGKFTWNQLWVSCRRLFHGACCQRGAGDLTPRMAGARTQGKRAALIALTRW
jgi:hypothetical protein